MSQYLLIKKLYVQNANAIAGLTYGFPAMTNFLGFAHAISRKLPNELNVVLDGVMVISHKNTVHVRQPKGWGDYIFALSRNPLTQQGNTAPINEEGRLSMEISLLLEMKGYQAGDQATSEELIDITTRVLPTLRLAGGQIISFESVSITTLDSDRNTLRQLMPGFALIDRSNYLAEHFAAMQAENSEATQFDAWCDFAMLKYKAVRSEAKAYDSEDEETYSDKNTKADWHYVRKPQPGYLVPISTGYCAISKVYEQGEVANVRDPLVPVLFAEAAYSVGEWKSLHGLPTIDAAIWRYEHRYPWYLAKSESFIEDIVEPDNFDENSEMTF
ncbi:type I-F CRISPR-associated protein Csy2 [uncultured Alteromonas sp.]|uniref:type I-F CRISPR-associated protein Csy2 n=1 Tax=uncultured Alteromonas sp. TaxID=179113 RepID=UPI000C0E0949|nr:MAG: type I-F CRISPR-associated protein Csy2 [Alteromonas sp.]